jgi:hypothetical protein
MKCLTICQPWATAFLHGPKLVENRQGGTSHRGALLIHAGKSLDWYTDEACALIAAHWPGFPANRVRAMSQLPLGAIIGVVSIAECVQVERLGRLIPDLDGHPFASGPWCWVRRPKSYVFEKPIPYRGQQLIYEVPDHVVRPALVACGALKAEATR